MSHYFIDDRSLKSNIKKINYEFAGVRFTFTTDSGLFSKDHVDYASNILLHEIPPLSGSLLDMGCGYGCIGIVLAKTYGLQLTQVDVNQHALDFTKINCDANNVQSKMVKSNCFDNVSGTFDIITVNPPIHAGKAVTYEMYDGAFAHLNMGGKLYVVTLKKHGAESTGGKLESVFGNCEVLYKKKGYYVFCCVKN